VVDANGRVLAPRLLELPDPLAQRIEKLRDDVFRDGALPVVWAVPEGAGDLPPGRWGDFKKVPGVLLAALPLDGRVGLYTTWGDWLPWTCLALIAVLFTWTWLPRVRSSDRV
jgi:hypothetical protein